ncbi:S8 family serine peptidase [Nevskia ramosa]|uniref:S8 family serine peptidase n=1 Tax=Nevskia ramosa TaxID=64002 RepID=UPI0003B6EB27|nr:S8 family serine peptidase [Nevskia ramosa]
MIKHHNHRSGRSARVAFIPRLGRWLIGAAIATLSVTAGAVIDGPVGDAGKSALEQRGYRLIGDRGELILPDSLRNLRGTEPDLKGTAIVQPSGARPDAWPLSAAQLATDKLLAATDFRSRAPDAAALSQLQASARRDGKVPVIITLKMLLTPEGMLGAALAQRQQGEIAALQARVLDALRAHKIEIRQQYRVVPMLAFDASPAVLDLLARLPEVAVIQEDLLSSPALADSVPLIGAADIQDLGIKGGNGDYSGVVAVLDTGIDRAHTFLRGFVAEACFSSKSNCPNGQTTQTGDGAASKCTYSSGPYADACDHGTHVSGIAIGAARLGSTAMDGVAPDTRLMPIQVFSRYPVTGGADARSYSSDQIAALQYVYDQRNNYRIAAANMSLGSGYSTEPCDNNSLKPIIDTLRSVNIATVISAGNDGNTDGLSMPGCISTAISVAATNKDDTIAFYSNRSKDVKLFAPGSNIVSSCPGLVYCAKSGTSMAAPHVAGAFSLLRDAKPGNTVSQNLAALQKTGPVIGTVALPSGGLRLYQRIFLPPAAGLDVVRLESGVPRNRREPSPNRHAYEYVSTRRYWSAVAARPVAVATNLGLKLYEDQGTVVGGSTVTPLASSSTAAGDIQIIAQDHNNSRRPIGTDRVEANLLGGLASRYVIEYAKNDNGVLGNSVFALFPADSVVQIHDLQVQAGQRQYVRVQASGDEDYELLAFTSTSDASTWQRGRQSATAVSSVSGAGGDEALSFTADVDGYAGIVLTRKSGSGNFYTIYRDVSAPVGSLTINNDAASTDSRDVTLNLNASDAETGIESFRVAADGVNFGAWQPYTTSSVSTPLTLPVSSGVATVAVQYRNRAFQPSPIYVDSITVNAPLSISIDNVRITEGNSGATVALFTVSLDRVASSEVSIDYATANGTATVADGDYLAASGTLTIAAGRSTRTFGVTINGDTRSEPDETFFVNLSKPRGGVLGKAQGVATIVNDDSAAGSPGISVQTRSFNFGSVRVGQSSVQRSLVITSTGTAPLAITSIRLSGDYTGSSNCPKSLAPGATCALTGSFKPTAVGPRPGSVTILSNAPDSPTVIQLSGTGI